MSGELEDEIGPAEPEVDDPTLVDADATDDLAPASADDVPAHLPDENPEPDERHTPGIWARGLTVAAGREVLVGPLDLDVPQGSLVVVEGPAGAGRSVLLLALTGRMRGVGGDLEVAGTPATRGRQLRARTSVARISDLVEIDDPLTVAECVTERCLTDGVPTSEGSRRMAELEDVLGFRVPRKARVADLSQLVRVLLLAMLAQLRPADLVVLDDLDEGLSPEDQGRALDHLARLAESGPTVVVSALALPPGTPDGTRAITLPAPAEQGEVLP